MATTNYEINYEDERFKDVEVEKQTALNEVSNTYNNMITQSDKYYQDQINAAKDYANTQRQIQQQNTDFAIEQINQQKEQAGKDYTKEQSASYVDYQRQLKSNEQNMTNSGLANAGYSESSRVSMYNQYQGRVASARESYNQAVLNYDNAIKEARLANNSALAEIAYNALQTQLELSLQEFQYKNQLIETQLQQKQATEDRYYSRWQDVLGQMNQENQFAESIRQYEQDYAFQTEQFEEQKRQYEQNYAQQIKEYNESIRQFDEQMQYYREKDAKEYALEIQRLEEQKSQAQIAQAQWEKEYQLQVDQFNQSQTNWEKEYNAQNGIDLTNGTSGQIKTKYYSGAINPDTQYGTFKTTDNNGVRYQPDNVGGNKLSSTGLTIENNGVVQNIWATKDGKYYYWEGRENKYKTISSSKVKALQMVKKAKDITSYFK